MLKGSRGIPMSLFLRFVGGRVPSLSCVCGALLGLSLAACGGVSADPPGGGGSSSGGGSSGSSSGGGSGGSSGGSSGSSSGGTTQGCPPSPPTAGSSCALAYASFSCEYGGDQDLECDTLATCSNATWSLTEAPTDGFCPTSKPGKNGCPASYSGVHVGQACSGVTDCAYPQGRCACTVPIGGPVELEDAGAEWICETPESGCPEPRPQAGTSCDSEGLTCDYGTCTLPGGTAMECAGGRWSVSFSACAELAHASGR
jgi:hypothetical protein